MWCYPNYVESCLITGTGPIPFRLQNLFVLRFSCSVFRLQARLLPLRIAVAWPFFLYLFYDVNLHGWMIKVLYPSFMFHRRKESHTGFGKTWGWVNDDRIWQFCPFKTSKRYCLANGIALKRSFQNPWSCIYERKLKSQIKNLYACL